MSASLDGLLDARPVGWIEPMDQGGRQCEVPLTQGRVDQVGDELRIDQFLVVRCVMNQQSVRIGHTHYLDSPLGFGTRASVLGPRDVVDGDGS